VLIANSCADGIDLSGLKQLIISLIIDGVCASSQARLGLKVFDSSAALIKTRLQTSGHRAQAADFSQLGHTNVVKILLRTPSTISTYFNLDS
jgi:hypothetical protein